MSSAVGVGGSRSIGAGEWPGASGPVATPRVDFPLYLPVGRGLTRGDCSLRERDHPQATERIDVIRAEALSRRFGDVVALEGLDLEVRSGEVFGLLGPNGAGKTTTLRLLSGIMRPTSGRVHILGVDVVRDPGQAKARTGYVAQAAGLYGDLTVDEHLQFYASLYGAVDPAFMEVLVKRYGFSSLRKRLARNLSGGYRTRLSLLAALVHRPEVLFLDEPTAGVDPVTRKELWDLFYTLKAEGVTLLVSTHYMEEAERCDRLAFLVNGRLAALGTPADLRGALDDSDVFEIQTGHSPSVLSCLADLPGLDTFNQFGAVLRLICRKGTLTTASIAERLAPLGVGPDAIRAGVPSLEDVFVVLTRRGDGPVRGDVRAPVTSPTNPGAP